MIFVPQLTRRLGDVLPPGRPGELAALTAEITAWRDAVLEFASDADIKLGSSPFDQNAFLPPPPPPTGTHRRDVASRNAQYQLSVANSQLQASRERSAAASNKLMEVNGQLGTIMAQIAKIDIQKHNVSVPRLIQETVALTYLCRPCSGKKSPTSSSGLSTSSPS